MKPESCGLGFAFEVVGGKWKALLLWLIHQSPRRFGELKKCVPDMSEKMLIQSLKEMQANGLIHREDFQQIPPKVIYSITEIGIELENALIPLAEWGKKYGS